MEKKARRGARFALSLSVKVVEPACVAGATRKLAAASLSMLGLADIACGWCDADDYG